MTDQQTEPTTEERPVEIEDDAQQRERMEELEERIAEGGITPEQPDEGTRGGMGSPTSMVDQARQHLGYRETGDNDTKFNRWLGKIPGYPHDGYGYPWCHAFISFCLWHSDNADAGPRTAGCLAGVAWFKQKGRWHSTPQVGDIVYFGAGGGTHVELVTAVGQGTITTIGGNTSGAVEGKGLFNGNAVAQKVVRLSSRIHGYGRPLYSTGGGGGGGGPTTTGQTGPSGPTGTGADWGPKKAMTSVRSVRQQQEAVNALGYPTPLVVDGVWGPNTAAGVKWLQGKVGAGADGAWGPETERLFKAAK